MGALRKGARVQSRRWTDVHGTVTAVQGGRVFVRWDTARFSEDEITPDEVRPSSRPAPRDGGPGYAVVRRG
jgi:hypothetical protein